MEFNQEEVSEPVSPTGQYLSSSVLSLTILAMVEFEVPINNLQIISFIKDVILPTNPRFSSIMVGDKKGEKKWKQVEVKVEDHVKFPIFPKGNSVELYDECLSEYLSMLGMDQLPQSRPLWEVHMINYPTSNAAGNMIIKIHHSLGDGYSIIGTLLSCFQRADNPELPLTFPSRQPSTKHNNTTDNSRNIFRFVSQIWSGVINSVREFFWTLLMSNMAEDDPTAIRSDDDGVEFRPMTMIQVTFSLDHLKEIKTKLEVTITDVITGIIFYGARIYMEDASSHELSNSRSTALVVLNTRNIGGYKSVSEMLKPNAEMPWGNHFTFLHIPIPNLTHNHSSNPLKFVLEAHQFIKRQRNSSAVYLTGWLLKALTKLRGPEVTGKYVHSTLKKSSMVISNLIGPLEKVALDNHPVRGFYFNVVGSPQMSYMGKMKISFGVEKGFIDPKKLKSCIENAFDAIYEATVQSVPPENSKNHAHNKLV